MTELVVGLLTALIGAVVLGIQWLVYYLIDHWHEEVF
jgi:hypothetical protein